MGISWFALEYFVPAPPAEFTIVTGSPNQTYEAIGKRYREILARSHVKVEVRNTPGAVENLKLLNDPKSGIQVGIVQGGVGNSDKSPDLLSLGHVTYQVFWIFYRGTETWDDVRQLKGKRIALGLEGSGGRVLAEDILRLASGTVCANSVVCLIFLNTFSQILGRNWLRHFDRALNAPGVGIVGATGSWLSYTSGYEGALKRSFYQDSAFADSIEPAFQARKR